MFSPRVGKTEGGSRVAGSRACRVEAKEFPFFAAGAEWTRLMAAIEIERQADKGERCQKVMVIEQGHTGDKS